MIYAAYYRVSTDRQGRSGLGLEAQQSSVLQFMGQPPAAQFIEVESGRKADRPQLAAAIEYAKANSCALVVAKLDRLARDVRMILTIVDSGVSVRFVDLPDIDTASATGRLILTVMASLAEFEAKRISERTKDALKAKKARGEKLGSPNPAAGGEVMAKRAHIASLQAANICLEMPEATLSQIAQRLISEGIPSPAGCMVWHPATVARVKRRANLYGRV
jgi:DNA invertase Pin-like site-specific DNA recombinase